MCAIEMALWDLAGKAYGVPVYQMLGGKFRDKIRCYADTTESHDPKVYGAAAEGAQGAGLHLAQDGSRHRPDGGHPRHDHCARRRNRRRRRQHAAHVHRHRADADKGIEMMADYVAPGARAGGLRTCRCRPTTSATSA